MLRRSLFFVFLLPVLGGGAQPLTRFDALKAAIGTARTPPQKLKALLAFCNEWDSFSPDTLERYAAETRALATAQADAQALLLAAYYQAVFLYQKNRLDPALALLNDVLRRYTKDYPYDETTVKLYALKSNVLLRTKKMDALMASNFELIKKAERQNDTLGMARGTLNIGNVNLLLKKYEEAMAWFHKALALMQTPFYRQRLSFLYNNIGIAFYHLAKEDSALHYIRQGIRYSREDGNLTNLANALFLYGGMLAEFKRPAEAETYFKEGLAVRRQIGDAYYVISDMAQSALFYADNQQPQKGIALCKEGMALAAGANLPVTCYGDLYESLSRCYEAAGDYKAYGGILVKQMALKDSVYRQNSAEALAEIQGKYELQKKETTIAQQQLDLVRKNYFLYGSLALFLLALAAVIVIFAQYKRRQRLKLRLMQEEESRKAERAVLWAEETERKRIAADLHDSLGAYAASIASGVDHLQSTAGAAGRRELQVLQGNAQAIVSQLNDTIWILKKDAQMLTAISDRLKLFVQRIAPSYPQVTVDVWEEIERDHLLPPAQAFHLFQIIKEGVNNALRHSRCRQVAVRIESRNGWRISITDDGSGLLQSATLAEGGNGLHNMRTRAAASGWTIAWQTNLPRGTRVIIEPDDE